MLRKSAYIKTIIVLFAVSVMLLITHLIISAFYPETQSQNIISLNDEDIETQFVESLHSFALKDEWIRKLNSNDLILSYQVSVPSDLPISYILFDLNQRFYPYNIFLRAVEKKLNERTVVSIIESGKNKLNADFISSPNIKRQVSTTSLFIYGRETNEPAYDSLFRYLTREYSALLVPSKSNVTFGNWLKENGFGFGVLINDKVNELDYRLEKDFSEERINIVVRNLVGGFPTALFFMVDTESEIFTSPILKHLKSEFDKRKIKLLDSNFFEFVDNSSPSSKEKFFNCIRNIVGEGKNKIAVSYEAFVSFDQEIKKLLRAGFKFERLKKDEL